MAWMLPGAGPARLWIVIVLAYVVGLAGFAHAQHAPDESR
jgi:hypothetical protein